MKSWEKYTRFLIQKFRKSLYFKCKFTFNKLYISNKQNLIIKKSLKTQLSNRLNYGL
jgi:hypothetical protein